MTVRSESTNLANTVARLLRRNAVKNLSKILVSLHPADIAGSFRGVSRGRWMQLFELVQSEEVQAEILTELDEDILEQFVELLDDARLAGLMREMSSDDAADILHLLPDERAQAIMAMARPDDDLADAVGLLRYEPDTAGGLMVPLTFALQESLTAGESIDEIQEHGDELEMVFYLYVLNEHSHLVGVCSLRDLITAPRNVLLSEIMETDVIRVSTETDQEEVARIVARYNLLAVPVVDDSNKLMGMVTVDDIIDVIREEATEDMLRMAGVSYDSDVSERGGIFASAKTRIPWLFASFLGGVAAVGVIASFESTLEAVAILAAFIPITLGMGGNVGTQSSTIITRGIALGRIETNRLWSVVSREIGVGVFCGLVYGLLLGGLVAIFAGDAASPLMLSITVGLAILSSMTIAALVGGLVPLIFERIRVDPAIAAGPFVTTSVDVLGILAYFSIAKILLGI